MPSTPCQTPKGERCHPDGASPCPVAWEAEVAVPAIQQAKTEAEAVIVFIHWGFEYEMQPDPGQERGIAALLRAAGADMVIGHHPHTAQPIVADADGLTAFSVGNFVFDQETAVTQQGLALLAYFDEAGLRGVQALPIKAGVKPRLLAMAKAEPWLTALLPPPSRLAFACSELECESIDAPPATESGQFYSGQIDLTGDGKPETVRKEGERITIYEGTTSTGSVAVWQSPLPSGGWWMWRWGIRMTTAVMKSCWQSGARMGRGTSAVNRTSWGIGAGFMTCCGAAGRWDPIQELALADVDGDGIEELVVIIEQADGLAQAVAVWQWQGWSFSWQWQSEPGWYENLVIGDGGERPLITVNFRSLASPRS
ncbi:MAG: CapA family protein [Chloroflexi bacterium]|nr:CapA family protein [Chloroflexota bacterium]